MLRTSIVSYIALARATLDLKASTLGLERGGRNIVGGLLSIGTEL
jgi:hypothetical protein